MGNRTVFLFFLLFLLVVSAFGATQATFYVSPTGSDSNPGTFAAPFQTITKAQDAVRTVNSSMTGDIVVYLRGGLYALSQTLLLISRDGGTNNCNVIYKSYNGERAVITGGKQITGWTSAGGGIWKTSSGGLRFRQLYINNKRGIRARIPNEGSSYPNINMWVGPDWPSGNVPDGRDRHIEIDASLISTRANLNKVEMIVSKEWVVNKLRIQSVSSLNVVARVYFRDPDVRVAFGATAACASPTTRAEEPAAALLSTSRTPGKCWTRRENGIWTRARAAFITCPVQARTWRASLLQPR